MAGGGSRRDDGSLVINSTNGFAALGSLRKKKKSDKDSSSSSARKQKPEVKEVFWAPTPLTVKSWADVDDEDDDDYYATTAPPQTVWSSSVADQPIEKESDVLVEESESEEDIDEADDDIEEDHEHDVQELIAKEPLVTKPPEVFSAPKDTERQLSKKELKKKGLEELDAVLAELGLSKSQTSDQGGSQSVTGENKAENGHGELEKESNTIGESKSAKKKKKKDKSSKEVKESHDLVKGTQVEDSLDETTVEAENAEDASAIDMKERLKKVVPMKKKKTSKEMVGAAKAAASEAAARNAKLAAAKKKEKNHYNQQPMR